VKKAQESAGSRPANERDAARKVRFVGTLAIASAPPGATVLIDRVRVGETPLGGSEIRAGSHLVWIEHSGYRRWTAAVSVAADKTTRISASLEPDGGR
jgi:hypothetical protein